VTDGLLVINHPESELIAFLVSLRTLFGPAINAVDPQRKTLVASAIDLQKRSDRGI
jgi:hypothetical protein